MKKEQLMKALANHTNTSFDGGNDSRLFFDREPISIFASDMTRFEYDKMVKEINTTEIKGEGFTVYCWNDCSGYDYWSRHSDETNYIMVTADIKNIRKVDINELTKALESMYFKMSKYDNVDQHDFTKK